MEYFFCIAFFFLHSLQPFTSSELIWLIRFTEARRIVDSISRWLLTEFLNKADGTRKISLFNYTALSYTGARIRRLCKTFCPMKFLARESERKIHPKLETLIQSAFGQTVSSLSFFSTFQKLRGIYSSWNLYLSHFSSANAHRRSKVLIPPRAKAPPSNISSDDTEITISKGREKPWHMDPDTEPRNLPRSWWCG